MSVDDLQTRLSEQTSQIELLKEMIREKEELIKRQNSDFKVHYSAFTNLIILKS